MEFEIYFRPLKLDDAEFINNMRQNTEMENLIAGNKRFVSLEKDKKWLENIILSDDPCFEFFAINQKETDTIIGYASIADIDYRNGKCVWSGLKIDTPFSKKGFGFQSTLLLIKHVFEQLRIERFHAECLEEHEASLKMMLKAGFVKEGLLRHGAYKDNRFQNIYLLSMLRQEYDITKSKYEL